MPISVVVTEGQRDKLDTNFHTPSSSAETTIGTSFQI